MPVCSYLVYPVANKIPNLMQKLDQMKECDATLSEDEKMIILLTETENKKHEEKLQQDLKEIKEINCLVLSFGQIQEAGATHG